MMFIDAGDGEHHKITAGARERQNAWAAARVLAYGDFGMVYGAVCSFSK